MPIGEVGEKYERLEVVEVLPYSKHHGNNRLLRVLCECGTSKLVRRGNFRIGTTKSCGCKRRENNNLGQARRLPPGRAAANTVFLGYRSDAKQRGYDFELHIDEFMRLTQMPCAYCGDEPRNKTSHGDSNGAFTYNGIDRIDNTKGYIEGNMNPCCRLCNRAKSNLPMSEWISWIERLVKRNSIA